MEMTAIMGNKQESVEQQLIAGPALSIALPPPIVNEDLKSFIMQSIRECLKEAMNEGMFMPPAPAAPPPGLGFVTSEEEKEAQELITENLKKLGVVNMPRPVGVYLLIKVYVREEDLQPAMDKYGNPVLNEQGDPVYVAVPQSMRENDQFTRCTGLVLARSPHSYSGARFAHTGPWCRVGDWVIFPRNEGIQFNSYGVAMQLLFEDRVCAIVDDPSSIMRG